MKKISLLLFIVFCCHITIANDSVAVKRPVPAPKQSRPIALIGGTLHTMSGVTIENGILTFKNGKIETVSTAFPLPPGYERIVCKGKHIYPGLFSAATTLGLNEIGAVRATRDANETGRINPNARAEIAINPESELIPVTRANGITTAFTAPQGGIISGTGAIINLDGWTYEEMTVRAPAALIVNFPSLRINTAWWEQRSEEDQKKDREKSLKELRDAFNDARAYRRAKESESTGGTPYHNNDSRWNAMVPVLEKKIPVLIWANDMMQIEAAVAFAEEMDIKIIIGSGNDAWRITELLKKKNIPVLAASTHRLPEKNDDAYDEPFLLPQKLHHAGVQYCITADEGGDGNYRNLPYQAATAVAHGLPHEEGLKAITLYPAQIFGVAERMGSLEVGKDATLIITDGDILDIRSNVEMEFIEGKKIDLTSRHTQLYEKYKMKYRKE